MSLGDLSLMELFRAEVETQTAALNEGLLSLESDPASKDALSSLMRAAHSIKGAARIVNLDDAIHLAHAMEDCFEAARDGQLTLTPEGIDVLLQGVDFFGRLIQTPDASLTAWLETERPRLLSLQKAVRQVQSGQTPSVPAPADAQPPAPAAPPLPAATASLPPASPIADLSLLDLFRAEVETNTASLNDGLIALESCADRTEALANLMRAAHSIKGAARIVNLEDAVRLAHAMEDCLDDARHQRLTLTSDDVDVLLKGVDLLVQMGRAPETEITAWLQSQRSAIDTLVAAIGAVRTGKAAGRPDVPSKSETKPSPAKTPAPPAAGGSGVSPKSDAKIPSGGTPEPLPSAPQDRAVKVTAESLDRLMGLAAETLVETNRLQSIVNDLLRLKSTHARLGSLFLNMRHSLETGEAVSLPELVQNAHARLEESRRSLGHCLSSFESYSRQSTNLADRLYRELLGSRMRPFADATPGFPRLVRDVSRQLGKKVKLDIAGKQTEVDRDILQKLEAPLNHLIRNALDHGFETPVDRVAAGKPEEATLRIEARHRAGNLIVTVTDDGRGINLDRLREKVVEKALTSPDMAAKLSEQELLDFLFLPGFSTAKQVTEISGRGVGLDVVQSMVHEAGGSVRIFTKFGQGTTFQLQLPITRSVIRALIATIGGEPYAFPLARIERTLTLPLSAVETVENRQFFPLDGQNVGLIAANQVLNLPDSAAAGENVSIVVIAERNQFYGLAVDAFVGQRDLVVRPLDPRLGKVPDIAAAAILEDGSPTLILDVEDVARSIDSLLSGGGLRRIRTREAKLDERRAKRVLVVDDSVTVREVERKLLENRGYEVEVAIDGMEGWNAVRLGNYDLVISDVDMPRMNGIEFVKLIKADPQLRDLPVMIVSYKDREEDRVRGLDAGANYYLAKSSFHDETLIHAVEDLIGKPKE